MPHDAKGSEIKRGDQVRWGKRIGTVVAIDPEVCLCTVDLRGIPALAPANRLEKLEQTAA